MKRGILKNIAHSGTSMRLLCWSSLPQSLPGDRPSVCFPSPFASIMQEFHMHHSVAFADTSVWHLLKLSHTMALLKYWSCRRHLHLFKAAGWTCGECLRRKLRSMQKHRLQQPERQPLQKLPRRTWSSSCSKPKHRHRGCRSAPSTSLKQQFRCCYVLSKPLIGGSSSRCNWAEHASELAESLFHKLDQ